MKAFFEKHKVLKILGFTLLIALATNGVSYLLNTIVLKGISADIATSIAKIAQILVCGIGIVTEGIFLGKGIKNKVDVSAADKRADGFEKDKKQAEKKVLDYDKDIANGTRTIKHPNDSTKDTTVPALGTEINNITVEKNNVINKGKAAGENITNIINTNAVINNLLSKNVELQQEENDLNALIAKVKNSTATEAEIEAALTKIVTIIAQQRTDNLVVKNAANQVTNEAINLTK